MTATPMPSRIACSKPRRRYACARRSGSLARIEGEADFDHGRHPRQPARLREDHRAREARDDRGASRASGAHPWRTPGRRGGSQLPDAPEGLETPWPIRAGSVCWRITSWPRWPDTRSQGSRVHDHPLRRRTCTGLRPGGGAVAAAIAEFVRAMPLAARTDRGVSRRRCPAAR